MTTEISIKYKNNSKILYNETINLFCSYKLMKRILIIAILLNIITFGYASDKEYNFLVITDIHLDINKKTPMVIDPAKFNRENELDKNTFNKMINLIKSDIGKSIAKPNSILMLGDMVRHPEPGENNPIGTVVDNELYIYRSFDEKFANIPVLYTFGNNDNIIHYGNFNIRGLSPYTISKNNNFDGFISHTNYCFSDIPKPCLLAENTIDGYYIAMLDDKLELINLNSILFSRKYDGTSGEEKSKEELEFLSNQLKKAKTKGNSVLIATHIPVGNDSYDNKNLWTKEYTEEFIKIIKEYKDTVIGIVNGHTHVDEVRILPIDENTNIGEYTTTSLTTVITNAPGFKSFTLAENSGKWTIKDYSAYSFIEPQINDLKIKKLYTFTDEYCDKNSYKENINNCLKNVTLDKMSKFTFIENPNVKPRKLINNSLYIS